MSGHAFRRARRAIVALAGVLIVWLAALGAAVADAKPRLNWTPCFTDAGPFECAHVPVPLDYDRPGGAKISIALTRLPATDPRHRIGSLFLNPAVPAARASISWWVPARSSTPMRCVPASIWWASIRAASCAARPAVLRQPDDWPPPSRSRSRSRATTSGRGSRPSGS
jgi:hypothetical protein